MSEESPLIQHIRVLWRYPIHIVAAFVLGGVGTFVYSYGPLHRAERWQIGYLEQRVDEQNGAIRELETQLAELRQESSEKPDPEVLAAERREAASAKRDLASARKEAKRSERTITSLRRSVSQWKSKYEKAQSALDAASAAQQIARVPEVAPGPPAEAQGPPDAPTGGASEAPVAAPDPAEVP